MGNLLKETPHSETNSTLEVLDRFGVTRMDFEQIRANNGQFGALVALFIKKGGWPEPVVLVDIAAILGKWQRFCREVFGRDLDVSALKVPAARGDINVPLVVTEDLGTLVAKCKERFGYWQWTDEDLSKIVKSDRTVKNGAYIVLVRASAEADEIHKNKSADDLKREGIMGITLEERLTYELFHQWDTGTYLDLQNVTLCTGSRLRSGAVPNVNFNNDNKVNVNYYNTDSCDDYLRVREVVSIKKATLKSGAS